MEEDEFLDIVEVVRNKNSQELHGIRRAEIAQVFLFFDHDAHANDAVPDSSSAIRSMLAKFNNETEMGKLFISYPMVEAIKECSPDPLIDKDRLLYSIAKNTEYKKVVGSRSSITDIRKWSSETWTMLRNSTLKRVTWLVHDTYQLPTRDEIATFDQCRIFQAQLTKHIPDGYVAILSGFPMFLEEYFASES